MHEKTTLFKETGNIYLNRVSEETRKKVAEETARIVKARNEHNHNERDRFKREEHLKLRSHELARHKMIETWQEKTKTSPYKKNLLKEEIKKQERIRAILSSEAIEEQKLKTMDSLTGSPKFDIATESRIKSFKETEVQLSLLFRKQRRCLEITHNENQIMNALVTKEIDMIRKSFPELVKQFENKQILEMNQSTSSTSIDNINESDLDPFQSYLQKNPYTINSYGRNKNQLSMKEVNEKILNLN